MSSIPKAAQIRQQAAARREAQLQRHAFESGAPMRPMNTGGRFSSTNRLSRRPDRSADYFTQQELEQALEKRTASGGCFRIAFLGMCLIIVLLLAYFKYDAEMNLEVPQIESGRGFGEIRTPSSEEPVSSSTTDDADADASEEGAGGKEGKKKEAAPGVYKLQGEEQATIAKHMKALGIQKNAPATPSATEVDAERQRRRDLWNLKKQAAAAKDNHESQYGQLVTCGKACQEDHKQITDAYAAIDSILPQDVYKTIFGVDDTKLKRRASAEELKEAYEKQKAKVEKEETDGEDKKMLLAELKDAYEVLRSPESRKYYHLTGRKPMESMKHTSARHGGWGQEFYLGTYKHRIIFAILDYLQSGWGETIVLGLLASLILARLPSIISQTMKMQARLEEQENLDELTEKAPVKQ